MKLLCIFPLFMSGMLALGQTCDQTKPIAATSEIGGTYCIVGMPPDSRSLVGASQVVVVYGNKFRFALGPQTTQTPIGAATVPSLLAPSATTKLSSLGPTTPAAPKEVEKVTQTGKPPAVAQVNTISGQLVDHDIAVPDYPKACDQTDPNWPSDQTNQTERITKCWLGIRDTVDGEQTNMVLNLRKPINETIRNAGDEQRCYQQRLWTFRQPILTLSQAQNLRDFAIANNKANNSPGCYESNSETWPFDAANTEVANLTELQQQLIGLTTALGYSQWASNYKDANATLLNTTSALLTEATSYTTGAVTVGAGSAVTQTYSDLMTVVGNNKQWRAQLAALADLPSLAVPVAIDPCREWYGKGRTDTITLQAVDLSSTSGPSTNVALATNMCVPFTIASTGVGITFLASPTFAFVPGDNTGALVIGETATNKQSPLYALLYNVKLGTWQGALNHGIELFASPGVGLTSTSSTTTGDFLGGLSISFARRVLFVTPALDFGQRTQLAPGFAIGTPQKSLTSVPTRSTWQPGFLLAISFGIGPS